MKKTLIIFIVAIFFLSCEHEPEFYIDGKPYYTEETCIKDTTYLKSEMYYGYHYGKYTFAYGTHSVKECLEYRIDTIEIKNQTNNLPIQ